MKRKIVFCLLISVIFIPSVCASRFKFIFSPKSIATFSQTETGFYSDTVGHWCNYAATRLHNEGVFTGMKIGNKYYFGPEEPVSRGEFLLYVSAVLQMVPTEAGTAPFADFYSIPVWQRSTVAQMYKIKMIHGSYENGKLFFNNDESITRLDAAQILSNFLGATVVRGRVDYTDSYLIPRYAQWAVKNVGDYGLMNGYDDKSFRPYIRLNRAMLADILCNLKDYCEKEPMAVERLKNEDKK